jgi:hypothetical protein
VRLFLRRRPPFHPLSLSPPLLHRSPPPTPPRRGSGRGRTALSLDPAGAIQSHPELLHLDLTTAATRRWHPFLPSPPAASGAELAAGQSRPSSSPSRRESTANGG